MSKSGGSSPVVVTPPGSGGANLGGAAGGASGGAPAVSGSGNTNPPDQASPSQDVWELAEEEQPWPASATPPVKKDGVTPQKPKLLYFWKMNTEAKVAAPVMWKSVDYALFYMPLETSKSSAASPAQTKRSPSPNRKYQDNPVADTKKRKASDASDSRSSSKSSKRGASPPPEPLKTWDQILDEERLVPPSTGNCLFIPWNLFARLRQVYMPTDSKDAVIDWSTIKEENRVISGLGAEGQPLQSRPLQASNAVDAGDWGKLNGFFNKRFQLSQAKASSMDMTKFPFWSKTNAVVWKKANDSPDQSDGFSFKPANTGGGPKPPAADEGKQYVKLAVEEAAILCNADDDAGKRGITKDGIYITRDVMEQLKDPEGKSYTWATYCNTIPIRQGSGRINYITVKLQQRTSAFWNSAWTHGVAKQEAKAVRSRNVGGLELLLVVVDESAGVTTTILDEKVKAALTNALIPIKQTVQIVAEKDSATLKKTFSRYLLTSPFGDFETWIQEKDYISFLTSYPGYQIPSIPDDLKKAFDALKPTNKASTTNKSLAAEIAKQDAAAKTGFPKDYPQDVPGAVVGVVSSATVAVAGERDARKKVPDQGKQMGGSATSVAQAAAWAQADERIDRVVDEDTGLTWDAPGTYPAEWLHRLAFSWGSPGGNVLASANTNFVFGSSEANGLMTRYEKSWQDLFKKEKSYQNEKKKKAEDPDKFVIPQFRGLLTTINTPAYTGVKIPEPSVQSKAVKVVTWEKSKDPKDAKKDKVTIDGVDAPVDIWKWITDAPNSMSNLSFSLDYSLKVVDKSSIRPNVSNLRRIFYPFQRGFFTRIEAEVDFLLLDWWTSEQKKKLALTVAPGGAGGANLSGAPTTDSLVKGTSGLNINKTGSELGGPMHLGSPMIVSTSAPEDLPQANVWRIAVGGQPVQAGGVQLNNMNVVTTNSHGALVKVPLSTDALSNAASSGEIHAVVSTNPLTTSIPPVSGSQAATHGTTIEAPDELQVTDGPNGIPARFTLSGNIMLFGKFEEQLYSYYGEPSVGLRQVVPIKPVTLKLSDYLPHLAGSDIDSVQLQNTQFEYNEYTTAMYEAGTWLQTDVLFSGALQPVSDTLRNVFHQEKPLLHFEAFVSTLNDWNNPPKPSSLGLRGSIPGISIKFADLLEFTDLGIGLNIGRQREPWPPYDYRVDWGVSFFGTLSLETPNDLAPLVMNFMLNEYAGIMTIIMNMEDKSADFFGCKGLHLSNLQFTANFGIGNNPGSLALTASASLELRETTIDVGGHYSKGDWSFYCELEDFDFAAVRDLYEDLFGSPLHLSDHEIMVDELALVAGTSGITISGQVTIEQYSCAEATISISQLGLQIQGTVDDIHLAKGVVLTEASLNIFIGPTSDTTVNGPGTSFQFNINGTVSFGSNHVSASLYIAKDPTHGLVWTVYGGFQGAFSLSKIAPELKGSFLDLALQEACIIASSVDGISAAGSAIPAVFPIVKGVQVAATVGTIAALDHSVNNKISSTSGMTLQAMYKEDTSAFDLEINLATQQTVSVKNKSVWSGPISLNIEISANPSLLLLADFFVRVPHQDAPLMFTGGIRAKIDEAVSFLELKDQWWTDPFGLSKNLKIGPDVALQIGIVYAGPLYPSELGVAAGMMIGNVSGSVALSISEAPNDELIMVTVKDLGVRDLVALASTIFEHDFPQPDDFLRFKEVELYFSTGTTLGTTYYPPGASFSCDALVFGKEASIYCGVSKLTNSISVKGSLEPITIGPISISGYQPGTNAQVDVELSPYAQTVLINGGFRILELEDAVYLKASFLPNVSFEYHSKLDFSTHLKFELDATMKIGSFKGMASLESLDFDVDFFFQQDILDYIVAQMNTQILSAKKGVDDGIESTEDVLNKAQERFVADVDNAQEKFNEAKAAYDLKVAQVQGAFQAEETKSELQTKKLQDEANQAFQIFQNAVSRAQDDLRVANENRTKAIRAAQQNIADAEKSTNAKIDGALRNVKKAQDDMQKSFGNALDDLKKKQDDVDRKQSVVNDLQREYDQKKYDHAHCKWTEKLAKSALESAAGVKLDGAKAGLKIAAGLLKAAQAVVCGPGYKGAEASIKFYQDDLDSARKSADATLKSVNGALQETTTVQDALVKKASDLLNNVQTIGKELQDSNIAKKALEDFQKAEVGVLKGLSDAVTGLAKCAEKVAFDSASAGLAIARANTKDIDVAKSALKFVEEGTDAVMDVGGWMAKHTVNILNIKTVEVTGDLRGLCQQGTELKAHIEGTFAEENVDFSVDFIPAKGEEMVKRVFEKLMNDVKTGVMKIKKDL